jgi:predicted dehydrogenase
MVMDACLEVIGRRGTAQITDPDPGFSIWGEAGTGFPNAMLRAEVYGQIHGALTNELVDFVRSVLRGRKPLGASPRDSRAALEMGLAITRSAQTGQPVELQAGA